MNSPFAFRVKCDNQEWSGQDIPFCECKLLREPIENGCNIKACSYVNCPRKHDVGEILEIDNEKDKE